MQPTGSSPAYGTPRLRASRVDGRRSSGAAAGRTLPLICRARGSLQAGSLSPHAGACTRRTPTQQEVPHVAVRRLTPTYVVFSSIREGPLLGPCAPAGRMITRIRPLEHVVLAGVQNRDDRRSWLRGLVDDVHDLRRQLPRVTAGTGRRYVPPMASRSTSAQPAAGVRHVPTAVTVQPGRAQRHVREHARSAVEKRPSRRRTRHANMCVVPTR